MNRSRRLIIHPQAAREVADTVSWYQSQDPATTQRFQRTIEDAILQVFDAPLRWPLYQQGARHYTVRRFPYRIVYLVDDESVHIIAVAHYRQRPGYWASRL